MLRVRPFSTNHPSSINMRVRPFSTNHPIILAASSCESGRSALTNTVRSSHANFRRGVRQTKHIFQWAADVSSFSIFDKANLRHDEACTVLEFIECLLILRCVLRGFLCCAWQHRRGSCEATRVQRKISLPRFAFSAIFILSSKERQM